MSMHSAQIRHERFAGLLLIAAAGAALVLANGPWADAYHPGPTVTRWSRAMQRHVLAKSNLVGTYRQPAPPPK